MNEGNGQVYTIAEYFPEDAERKESGAVSVSSESLKAFDVNVAQLIADAETVVASQLNDYLKVVSSFGESDTGYVVTEPIEGRTFEEIMEKKKTPFTIGEATPVFLEFLKAAAEAAAVHGIYFHVEPATVSVTREGNLRLDYFYAPARDEREAAAECARFYYFMLTALPPGAPFVPIDTAGLPKHHAALIETLEKALGEGSYVSISAFYEELTTQNNNAPEPAEPKKSRLPFMTNNVKAILITAGIAAGLIAVAALLSFFAAKLVLDAPNKKTEQSGPASTLPPHAPERQMEFDFE
jgi:hypothetical protein